MEVFLLIIKIVISKYIIFNLYFFYRGLQNKYPSIGKTDYATSMIKGLIPDKYTMKQVKDQIEISEELRNNVRTMLFK